MCWQSWKGEKMPIPVGSLKKCNCGGLAEYKYEWLGWHVSCMECGNKTRFWEEKKYAQKEWNTEVCYEGYNPSEDDEIDQLWQININNEIRGMSGLGGWDD